MTRARFEERQRRFGAQRLGLVVAALLLSACSGRVRGEIPPIDCGIEDDYEFLSVQDFEPGQMNYWYGFGDPTPNAPVPTAVPTEIPDGRCESAGAMVFSSFGHTDWGSGFGEYNSMTVPTDARDYEGVSFWAKAVGWGTSFGFQMSLLDRNSHELGNVCLIPTEEQIANGDYTINEGGMTVPTGGDLPGPNDCGNTFQAVISARRQWHLHLIPFEEFRQTPNPNLVPAGIDRSGLYQFGLIVPKDSQLELWVDNLSVYRRREGASAAQTDESVD